MASRSSWSRFPPITLSAVTRDRRHRQDDELYAACAGIAGTKQERIFQPVAQSRVEGRLEILERGYGVRACGFGDLEVLGVWDGPLNG